MKVIEKIKRALENVALIGAGREIQSIIAPSIQATPAQFPTCVPGRVQLSRHGWAGRYNRRMMPHNRIELS